MRLRTQEEPHSLAPAIALTPLVPADVDALLDFELENRAFFEARINTRPSEFYCRDGVAAAVAAAERDACEDRAYAYLIRDVGNTIVGRINLTRVRRAHFHSAELGYRIGEAFGGRGYASAAVREVLSVAFDALSLRRIEAVTRPENVASARVLVRNGFMPFGRSTRSFELGGQWFDTLYFERHAGDTATADRTAREG